VFTPPVPWDLETVAHFDEAAKFVPPEAMRHSVLVSADPAQHAGWLHDLAELGFDRVYLHHVGQEQREFIDVFGAKVLPQLDGAAR
jgi:alkanesulfonate monooxygenase SsuD/methylene tetrahydromethanopterin reductase-like flavin-dependent oxidoreductase (luciferase family)